MPINSFYQKNAMKALFISLAISLTIPLISEAQTQKGRWMVGAQVGDLTLRTKDQFTSFSADLTPLVGYIVTDGLVVGAGLPIYVGTTRTKYGGEYYNHSSGFNIGLAPFVRYYIGKSSFKPYVGVAYSYTRVRGTVKSNVASVGYGTGATRGYVITITPTVGTAYFINRNLALTAALNYNVNRGEQTTTTTYALQPSSGSYISKDQYLSLAIGFQLFIGE